MKVALSQAAAWSAVNASSAVTLTTMSATFFSSGPITASVWLEYSAPLISTSETNSILARPKSSHLASSPPGSLTSANSIYIASNIISELRVAYHNYHEVQCCLQR